MAAAPSRSSSSRRARAASRWSAVKPPGCSTPGACGASGSATSATTAQAADDPPAPAGHGSAESFEGSHVRVADRAGSGGRVGGRVEHARSSASVSSMTSTSERHGGDPPDGRDHGAVAVDRERDGAPQGRPGPGRGPGPRNAARPTGMPTADPQPGRPRPGPTAPVRPGAACARSPPRPTRHRSRPRRAAAPTPRTRMARGGPRPRAASVGALMSTSCPRWVPSDTNRSATGSQSMVTIFIDPIMPQRHAATLAQRSGQAQSWPAMVDRMALIWSPISSSATTEKMTMRAQDQRVLRESLTCIPAAGRPGARWHAVTRR